MGSRKVSILEPAATAVAAVAWFIEAEKGLPQTAKKFVDDAFNFFEGLSDERLDHKACRYLDWKMLGYRCANFRKKYTVAYLVHDKEVVVCEFVLTKLIVQDVE